MATFVTKTVFDIFIKGMKDNPNKELYYFIGLLVLVGILLLINLFGNRIFEIYNWYSEVYILKIVSVKSMKKEKESTKEKERSSFKYNSKRDISKRFYTF